MSTINVNGIILSRRNFSEADRLLTVFSKEEGKIRILAKGSRKIKSKMASHIEPFSVGKYFLAKGKTFYILTSAETRDSGFEKVNDIELYQKVSYVCELLDLLTVEGQPNPLLFNLVEQVLKKLPTLENNKKKVLLRYLEYWILKTSGYSPDYFHCRECKAKLTPEKVFIGNFEGVVCNKCQSKGEKVSLETLKILRLFDGGELDKILNIKNIEDYEQKIKEMTNPYLYDILPKIPKSQNL